MERQDEDQKMQQYYDRDWVTVEDEDPPLQPMKPGTSTILACAIILALAGIAILLVATYLRHNLPVRVH